MDIMKQLLIPILFLLAMVGQSRAQDDNRLAQLLVGSWEVVGELQEGNGTTHLLCHTTFNADGQFHETVGMTFPPAPGQATSGTMKVTGTWQISNGNLSLHIVQVYPPVYASYFADSSAAIQFIDGNTYKSVGDPHLAHRIR
jgi:hypothetical protein